MGVVRPFPSATKQQCGGVLVFPGPLTAGLTSTASACQWSGMRTTDAGFAWPSLSRGAMVMRQLEPSRCHRKQTHAKEASRSTARDSAKKLAARADTELGSWSLRRFRSFESASLARYQTLWSFLGTRYPCTASRGHVRMCDVCDVLDLFSCAAADSYRLKRNSRFRQPHSARHQVVKGSGLYRPQSP